MTLDVIDGFDVAEGCAGELFGVTALLFPYNDRVCPPDVCLTGVFPRLAFDKDEEELNPELKGPCDD